MVFDHRFVGAKTARRSLESRQARPQGALRRRAGDEEILAQDAEDHAGLAALSDLAFLLQFAGSRSSRYESAPIHGRRDFRRTEPESVHPLFLPFSSAMTFAQQCALGLRLTTGLIAMWSIVSSF